MTDGTSDASASQRAARSSARKAGSPRDAKRWQGQSSRFGVRHRRRCREKASACGRPRCDPLLTCPPPSSRSAARVRPCFARPAGGTVAEWSLRRDAPFDAHEWVSFADPSEERTWLVDVTFLCQLLAVHLRRRLSGGADGTNARTDGGLLLLRCALQRRGRTRSVSGGGRDAVGRAVAVPLAGAAGRPGCSLAAGRARSPPESSPARASS